MAYNAGRSASSTNQAYGYQQQQLGYQAGLVAGAQYQAGVQAGISGAGLPQGGYTAEYEAGYQAGLLQLQQTQLQQQQLAQQGGQQYYGAGYGQRYLAPADIQAQLAGKPAFYDNIRGIYYDGKRAWYYDAAGAPGARNSYSSGSVITAIEQGPTGTVIRIGNGTQGNLEEHRNAPSSVYYNTPLAL
ncbi:hypothetical protein PRIPAC_72860 [Pristionchus pacificus]|uniref:Uncharacterized protein n=1 Tax=Pristionchus pacificus TaxID=54126 RepID=A0A2A6CSE2_PRIPA|nr:hypothetical protein PRIPAC_72860 [Pristionchus pacificus]|eukprot:PDM81059.1 hypothetical protein PRIPAC_36062 [Pristionchus pacificus]